MPFALLSQTVLTVGEEEVMNWHRGIFFLEAKVYKGRNDESHSTVASCGCKCDLSMDKRKNILHKKLRQPLLPLDSQLATTHQLFYETAVQCVQKKAA